MRKATGLLIIVVLVLASRVVAENWSWTTEVIDPNGGEFTSLRADKGGNIHLSYSYSFKVRYGFLPAGTTRWYIMDVANEGEFTNIAIDSKDQPHICYNGLTRLHHLWFNGKTWDNEEIAPRSGTIAYTCSLGVAPDGTVHMFWYQERAGADNFLHIRHAVKLEGVWYRETVDLANEAGKWNAAAVDKDGVAHICYSTFRNFELRYGQYKDRHWTFTVVDHSHKSTEFPLSVGNDLYLADDGKPRFSYEDSENVYYAEPNGDRWKYEVVSSLIPRRGWQEFRTRLVLDKQRNPHIVFQDAGALKHAWRDDGGWHVQFIAPAGADPYRDASIAVGLNNTLYVVYRDPGDGSLTMATGRTGAAATVKPAETKPTADSVNPVTASQDTPVTPAKNTATKPAAKKSIAVKPKTKLKQ